jgi:putative ABC transport system permease protein
MVLSQALKLTLAGVAIGLGAALALTRFMSSLLFGVSPTDPVIFVFISLLLIAVSLFASFVPARKAIKVDPMIALRYE